MIGESKRLILRVLSPYITKLPYLTKSLFHKMLLTHKIVRTNSYLHLKSQNLMSQKVQGMYARSQCGEVVL